MEKSNNHSFLYQNDLLLESKDLNIKINNRAFKYGDGLFETIKIVGGQIALLNYHFERISKGGRLLHLEFPTNFTIDNIQKKIEKLIDLHNIKNNGTAKIIVYRKEGGKYTPLTNKAETIIEVIKDDTKDNTYQLNKKGIHIGIYDEILKPYNVFANIKSNNALIYVMAGVFSKKNNLDDCLLLNEDKNIVEGVSSNVFIVDNDCIYTPALEEGCVEGVMRKKIIDLAAEKKIKLYECQLSIEDLLKANEIFLTNSNGLRWVAGFKKKRYFCNLSKKLNEFLNEGLKKP